MSASRSDLSIDGKFGGEAEAFFRSARNIEVQLAEARNRIAVLETELAHERRQNGMFSARGANYEKELQSKAVQLREMESRIHELARLHQGELAKKGEEVIRLSALLKKAKMEGHESSSSLSQQAARLTLERDALAATLRQAEAHNRDIAARSAEMREDIKMHDARMEGMVSQVQYLTRENDQMKRQVDTLLDRDRSQLQEIQKLKTQLSSYKEAWAALNEKQHQARLAFERVVEGLRESLRRKTQEGEDAKAQCEVYIRQYRKAMEERPALEQAASETPELKAENTQLREMVQKLRWEFRLRDHLDTLKKSEALREEKAAKPEPLLAAKLPPPEEKDEASQLSGLGEFEELGGTRETERILSAITEQRDRLRSLLDESGSSLHIGDLESCQISPEC